MEAALAPDAPLQFEAVGSNVADGRCASPTATTRWPAPTSSCAAASRTSASRSCRWKAPRSRCSRATTATVTSSPCTSRARCPTRTATRSADGFGVDPEQGAAHRAARRRRRSAPSLDRPRASSRCAWHGELRPAGEVGRDALREPDLDAARSRAGAVPRARAAPRRHDRRAARAASSATPVRTPASAACSRSDRRA